MNILFIYFTGTYNTRYLANQLKDTFKSGNNIDLIEVKKDSAPVDLNKYDLLFVGYPIYGFNSQVLLNNYLRACKKTINQNKKLDYIIFKNSGETYAANNSSSRIIKRILNKKHFNLISEYHFPMPYNIHFPFDNKLIKQIVDHNDKLLEIVKYNYDNHINHQIKSNFIYYLVSLCVSIQKIGGPVNSFFYRVDSNKCIKCKKCINICPMNNIYMNEKGQIKFHHNCAMCMRCSFYCPKDAINIGMLNMWKVNDYYNLDKIKNDSSIVEPFISNKTKGFYKCYIKTFDEIDKTYSEINH